MSLEWVREQNPKWDADKQRLFGELAAGLFPELRASSLGTPLPGEWWRVVRGDETVAYGWMDITWGDAEMLVAVRSDQQRHGAGTYVIDRLDEEAAKRGVRYLYNVVPHAHPTPAALRGWLERRGFSESGEGGLLRRQVRAPAV